MDVVMTDPERTYFSVRTGKHPSGGRLDLAGLKRCFWDIYSEFERSGYFQESFGYACVDLGDVTGRVGQDVEAFFFRKLRKQALWPINYHLAGYSEDDLFDVVELLYDCVSKGTDGYEHTYGDCGWHYESFDSAAGRLEFRSAMNEALGDYGEGYVLTDDGEVWTLPEDGLADLEDASEPPGGSRGRSGAGSGGPGQVPSPRFRN